LGRYYNNAPINEVVCEFQFEPTSPWHDAIADSVYEKLRTRFPVRRQVTQTPPGGSARPQASGQQFDTIPFTQFWSEDETALVQVGTHLLAVNHLKPYPSWQKLLLLTREVFQAYSAVASPEALHRIGLQYINRIEIAGQHIKLEDYFAFRPFVGEDLPQNMNAFTVGIQIPFADLRDVLQLQLTSLSSLALPNTAVFSLEKSLRLQGQKPFMDGLDCHHHILAFLSKLGTRSSCRDPFQCTLSKSRHSAPGGGPERGSRCGSLHSAATRRSGASGVLKPLKNSQKGSRMISNVATGTARNDPEPPGATSIRPNQPTMLPKNTRA
jgi:uncharacterized protein (TIGR04255 family)